MQQKMLEVPSLSPFQFNSTQLDLAGQHLVPCLTGHLTFHSTPRRARNFRKVSAQEKPRAPWTFLSRSPTGAVIMFGGDQ
jgi:hypothetical protein